MCIVQEEHLTYQGGQPLNLSLRRARDGHSDSLEGEETYLCQRKVRLQALCDLGQRKGLGNMCKC